MEIIIVITRITLCAMGFEIVGAILILTVPTGIWNGK